MDSDRLEKALLATQANKDALTAYEDFQHRLAYLPDLPDSPEDPTFANTMFDRLQTQLKNFQDQLQANQEVGAVLAHFGSRMIITVGGIGYHNPYLIILHGWSEDGTPVRLLQHVHQLSLLLTPVVVPEGKKARRIGFGSDEE